jgi:hypothetical protein
MSFNSIQKSQNFQLTIFGFSDQKIQICFSLETDEHCQAYLINDILGNIRRFLT